MIHKATDHIINVTGDLHGGCFHFIAAEYNIFLWKSHSEDTDLIGMEAHQWNMCYKLLSTGWRSCSPDCRLIGEETIYSIFPAYYKWWRKGLKFDIFEDEKELSVNVSINLLEWMEIKLTSTTDKCFLCPWITCISWIFIGRFVFQWEPLMLLLFNVFTRSSSPFPGKTHCL